ncbi:thioredoxin fold domain-containing protein [Campylobacter geochelonis]|uniref:Thiol peroxidase n=1 Tax=Campylobacter geochelonis TaxID=1780362 RepID=A0A128EMB2_9BACT|nr:thioredoxin fold domain-containing protein [Campylobacter geochelonis]QKF72069.1 protein disulfide isomerase, DsbG family [Campylobacter geochelonis]CZE45841.1 thiol peroxidase [Campylobacter geochelonis]CZE46796.1 thiol peroxidase [Campylobacter geochelonis]CZE49843.1 thiol peroxidase [Campylobacter geochelonis]
MKKLVLTSLVAATAVFAATNEEILSLYSGMPHDIKSEIAKREAVKEAPEFDLVVVKLSQGQRSQEEIMFTKGDFLIPDLINLKTGESYKAKYQQSALEKNLAFAYKNEKAENIIKLGNDPKKPTIIMFTDPECPYCRMEMDKIDDTLKHSNVEVIMTSVHGSSGDAKGFKIYQETKSAKTDADKLKIIKKYYDPDLKDVKASPAEIQRMREIANKYFEAGLKGVPTIIEKDKLN